MRIVKPLIAAAILAAVIAFGYRLSRSRTGSPAVAPPRYVGDSSCRTCHRTISDSYQRTAMGRAWYVPSPETDVEDYSENNRLFDASRNLHYEMTARDGKYFQREYRLDEHGDVVHELIREVAHVIGSGEHVRSYTCDQAGYLTEMPVSWFTEEKRWALSPGYQRYNHRFSRPITPSCVACHNDYPPHPEPTQNRYASMPHGIGCERCHGPAEWHVREESEDWTPPSDPQFAAIVNPARLPPERTNDVCFQCHLQGDVQFPFPGKHEFGFQPGMRLADYRSDFQAQTSDLSRFGVASHASRMVLSKCSSASNGRLTCVTCHDPHVPLGEVAPETYRRSCLSCHQPAACSRRADASAPDRADDCVACHMPRGEPEDVQHTVFTDHWIQRPGTASPPPGGSAEASIDPAHLLVRLKDFWNDPRSRPERSGIAHISFALGRGGRPNLEHGIGLLLDAAQSRDLHRDGWRKLGLAALVRPDPNLAVMAFRNALRHDERDGVSHLGLGSAYQARGDVSLALTQLERTVRDWPELLETYPALSSLYLTRREPDRAVAILEESLRRAPAQPDAWRMLGLIHNQIAPDPARALDAFRNAVKLDPDDVISRTAIGSLLSARGESGPARKQLELATASGPNHLPAWIALAEIQIAQNEPDAARHSLQAVLQRQPGHPHAAQLMRQLDSQEKPERSAPARPR